jgi:hypothetical protein
VAQPDEGTGRVRICREYEACERTCSICQFLRYQTQHAAALEASKIPAQKPASGDQMLKMFPQLGRHIAAHKQDTQLKIAEEDE